MQARTLTPAAIFGFHVRYVVPLFQRPYVWTKQDQWEPLWADVRTVAEAFLDAPAGYGGPQVAPHFLGAIVLEQPLTQSGYIAARHVIDGQQRLTTLQLLLHAAYRVAEEHGVPMDAQALRIMVVNEPAIAQQPEEVFKVWPTDRDQAAFQAAMDGVTGAKSESGLPPIGAAHEYFAGEIRAWAEVTGDPDKAGKRINALTQVLREHLKVVVIDLEPGDNAQVIFETLNHRGAPLLAADLIKNLVFQLATAQGLDVKRLYHKYWRELDAEYWRQKVARGRQYIPRIDIFVNYWLITRVMHEVPADRIFVAFRDYVRDKQPTLEILLAELSADAKTYAELSGWPSSSVVGRFHYRVVQAMDSAVVTPILLWLLRWPGGSLPVSQRDKALESLESWLVRRSLCRLTSKDINRLMLDVLQELDDKGPASAGDVAQTFLVRQKADSRLWPSDDLVRQAMAVTPVYKALLRARLRMLLEAIEDHRRTVKSEQAECPRGLTVEHVMPRAWREHWSADIASETDAAKRDHLIHTLGNLTLVNNKLNPALSNRPWTDAAAQAQGLGATGKRSEMQKHITLKINADLLLDAPDGWNHDGIRKRTAELTEMALAVWPRPAVNAEASKFLDAMEVDEPEPEPTAEIATSGKYAPLGQWLAAQTTDELPVSFDDIEEILGSSLPDSARNHPPYWYSSNNSLGKALAVAGFKATGVNLTGERAVLVRRKL